ncbi:MAG: hybrid sensor histidine kinase/response regulator [Gammaproteobacteria bacterium]|nr:hybrid sensor histidine kinase/response regulator [Gammaproteobacteria bacterium]MBU1646429.1 hybrid sensor histidine kinase/response regulator [Gammaproteobacteria bacterium]MBU1970972.1 hybrid sensor histidine kinase/response regulator [Gammaproteobacteria bacterium]
MSTEFTSADERTAVRAEQIRAFFKETGDQNLAGAIVLSLIVFVVHKGIPAWTWQPALLSLYGVTLVRMWLIRQYHRAPASRSTEAWGRGQTIAGALSGLCWGSANAAMLWHLPVELQFFILTVITVAAAANASEGFSYTPPSCAFILISLTPAIIWLLSIGDRLHRVLALMLTIFVPMTLWQSHKRNQTFIEAQQLRFRNEALARELKVQRDAAEQAVQAKARFLAAASHDLRQPMQALSIFHELLQNELQAAGRGDSALLDNARQSAEAMNALLDALLDISKLDANVVRADRRPIPVQALLDDMAREFMPLAEQKGLRLRVRPCAATIVSDPVLLGQVLRNLLGNAIRYTQEGGVLIGCRRRQGRLVIAVADTGIGIAANQHAAVFAEFFQAGNQARDRKQGLGLGLAIVQRLAHLLDHPLSLRSELGRGSCFAVAVPLAAATDAAAAAAPEAEDIAMAASLAGRRVLAIDDDEAIRSGLTSLLQGWGCTVTAAGSVVDALEQVDAGPAAIDAVVSDMGLPGPGNGIDAIVALRQRFGSRLPAILVTGDTSRAALQAATAANLILLHKPIKPAQLRAALSAALAQKPGAGGTPT